MTKTKGALIGCGFFAVNQMHGWQDLDDVQIVAICDRDPERLRIVGDQFGVDRRYQSAEDMFADGGFDFVDIATTVGSHRALVELAASHKVPAICQKPFAPTLADAKAMVAAADAAGIPLMIHENFRWQTPILAVKAVLDSGVIGEPFWGRVSFRSGFDVFSGQPYLAKGKRFIIEDLGIHSLDIAIFMRAFAGFVFFVLTAPVGAHLLARAAHKAGYRLARVSTVDEMRDSERRDAKKR